MVLLENKSIMKNLINILLSLIYKENCCICGNKSDNSPLCKTCLKDVKILSGFAQNKINGVEIYSATIYTGIIRQIIHKFKFCHKKELVSILADILNKYYRKCENLKNIKDIVVVPVPTSKNNINTRGYNNVYEIALKFARLNSFQFNKKLLLKTKNTVSQFKLNRSERFLNIKNSFSVNLKYYTPGSTVLIIDDITTTGATLEEIIKVLKENNINNIVCLTCAKAV